MIQRIVIFVLASALAASLTTMAMAQDGTEEPVAVVQYGDHEIEVFNTSPVQILTTRRHDDKISTLDGETTSFTIYGAVIVHADGEWRLLGTFDWPDDPAWKDVQVGYGADMPVPVGE